MKLLLAAPLYPPEIGGPATYARALYEGLPKLGIEVELVKFSDVRHLPKLVRHIAYYRRVLNAAHTADAIIGFDTWSTGIPALCAAQSAGKPFLVRIGGDFLWESYVGRTGELVKLSDFYTMPRALSMKERIIKRGTRWLTHRADRLVFNTAWQRDLWHAAYGFDAAKAQVIENQYPAERTPAPAKGRVFVAAGREHPLKNLATLERAFGELRRECPDVELDTRTLPPREHEARIRDAYAVVIPSVSEVSPNTAIDAIRYGKPFIAPLDNGARARLGSAGIFVDTLDVDALREAMRALLDPVAYAAACERVRAFTFVHSWDDIVTEFIACVRAG